MICQVLFQSHIKNLNIFYTASRHMQQCCRVSNYSKVNCKKNGIHKLKIANSMFCYRKPQKSTLSKCKNRCFTTTYHQNVSFKVSLHSHSYFLRFCVHKNSSDGRTDRRIKTMQTHHFIKHGPFDFRGDF